MNTSLLTSEQQLHVEATSARMAELAAHQHAEHEALLTSRAMQQAHAGQHAQGAAKVFSDRILGRFAEYEAQYAIYLQRLTALKDAAEAEDKVAYQKALYEARILNDILHCHRTTIDHDRTQSEVRLNTRVADTRRELRNSAPEYMPNGFPNASRETGPRGNISDEERYARKQHSAAKYRASATMGHMEIMFNELELASTAPTTPPELAKRIVKTLQKKDELLGQAHVAREVGNTDLVNALHTALKARHKDLMGALPKKQINIDWGDE